MIGIFIAPTIARILNAVAALVGFGITWRNTMSPKNNKNRMSVGTVLASHTHAVPHVGIPQIIPDASANAVSQQPTGAAADI